MILKNLFQPFFFQTQTLSSSSNSLMNFFILLPIVLINNVTLFKEGTAPYATVVYATFFKLQKHEFDTDIVSNVSYTISTVRRHRNSYKTLFLVK